MAKRNSRIVAAPVTAKSSPRVIRAPKGQPSAATVAPTVETAVSPVVVDIAAKRSDAAKRAVATRRDNAAKQAEANARREKADRLSAIAKRAAETRRANRAAGIAPRAKNEAPANRSDAATRANRTRLVAKLNAATNEADKSALAAKLAAFDAKHAPAAPAPTVDPVTVEVAKVNWFMRFVSMFS